MGVGYRQLPKPFQPDIFNDTVKKKLMITEL